MPVIIVYGISAEMSEKLEVYTIALQETVAYSFEELGLKPNDISCLYPADMQTKGLGEKIIIFVDGLLVKPERSEESRNKIAHALKLTTQHVFPDLHLIECIVRPFYLRQGCVVFRR